MKKRAFALALVVSLTGCGGGGGGGGDDSPALPGDPCADLPADTLDGIGSTFTVAAPVNLTVNGSANTITVTGTGTVCLLFTATNSMLTFTESATVPVCQVTGTDNTISRPASMALECDDTGLGNQFLTY